MVTRPVVIAVICVGFFLILQALVPKAMALRNPANVDRFMVEGQRTHKRKNYMMQRARDKEMGSIDNSIAYDVEPFDPDRNPEELSAFMVDYANMIRNDVILLDKSVETRTRKRDNIKVENYNQIIPDAPCKCEPSVSREILGEDVFPQEIEIRNCSNSQNSCIQPYACQNNVYNLTILKRRGLRPKDDTIHYNLRPNWYSVNLPISVGCTCNSDYIKENN